MSKRYGRNQKRAARERIAELESANAALVIDSAQALMQARIATQQAYRARETALLEYADRHGMIDDAIKLISYRLGEALGPRLLPFAEKLMASSQERSTPKLSARVMPMGNKEVLTLRGEIPALNYNVALW